MPAGLPPACELSPLEGIDEYAHLLALQFPDSVATEVDAPCDPAASRLELPAAHGYPARRCLPGLDRMLATFQRSCEAIDAWRE